MTHPDSHDTIHLQDRLDFLGLDAPAQARLKALAPRIAASVGLKPEDIINLEPKVRKAMEKPPAKYANPANPAEVWTGRGRQPKWVRDALDAGQTLNQLAIAQS